MSDILIQNVVENLKYVEVLKNLSLEIVQGEIYTCRI